LVVWIYQDSILIDKKNKLNTQAVEDGAFGVVRKLYTLYKYKNTKLLILSGY
jgi:hypothetical protein